MAQILVLKDIEKDKNSFFENLYGPQFVSRRPFIKKSIFKCFPTLKEKLENIENQETQKNIISEFLEETYQKYETKINQIFVDIKAKLENNSNEIFDGLEKSMDHQFGDEIYFVYISLKPNSTFGTNTSAISILGELFEKPKHEYLNVLIHELSHIIWFKKINKVYGNCGLTGDNGDFLVSNALTDYLKEIFAPIIIRHQIFDGIRDGEKLKNANFQQQLLNIEFKGNTYNIVDFFELIYQKEKSKGIHFDDIMILCVKMFLNIEDQIKTKNHIFTNTNWSIQGTPEFFEILENHEYMIPIKLNHDYDI